MSTSVDVDEPVHGAHSPSLAPLIGREADVAVASRLLQDPATRLLTVTGPGGTGKSRLAEELRWLAETTSISGTAFVSLAPLVDPMLVQWEIARTLGVSDAGGRSTMEAIHGALADRPFLLVLDNFEHVAEAASLVVELLQANPGLKVLATSREPLHIPGEQEFPLAPLSVPLRGADFDMVDPDELSRYGAVALFVHRARSANPAFALDATNVHAVAELCRCLDGLPLAIVIAAAQLKAFPPSVLLKRLRERGPLLWRRPEHGLAERERTMRAAIDWSHALLSADEAAVFRCLAAFAGDFSPEAAIAVSGVKETGHEALFDILVSLVDKSLLFPVAQTNGDVRYAMLETVRAYAEEQLIASGEREVVCRRHADYFVAFSEAAEELVRGDDQATWLDRVEAEHGNLRAALQWALDHGEVELALRLSGLRWFWEVRGHWNEGRAWLDLTLAAAESGEAPLELRAKALLGVATFAREQGDLTRAQRCYEEALEIFRERGLMLHASQALNSLGLVAIHQGDDDRAETLLLEGLTIRKALHRDQPSARLPRRGIAYSRLHLARAAMQRGDIAAAREELERCLSLFDEIRDARGAGLARLDWASTCYLAWDLTRAASCYRLALETFVKLGAKPGIAACLTGLAAVAMATGDPPERAARLLGAADAIDDAVRSGVPHLPRQIGEAAHAETERAMGRGTFTVAWNEGRRTSLSEIVSEAIEVAPEASSAADLPASSQRGLTAREVEVLRELVQGRTNPQIGAALLIAPHTVASHVKSIREKLGVSTRTAAVTIALRERLV